MTVVDISKQQFSDAAQAVSQLLVNYDGKLQTGKSSVINQLLVRPYAYVYAKINRLIQNWLNDTSVKTLSETQDTSDSIADLVASNYFVQRKSGSYAKGTVILTLTSTYTRIAKNTNFIIDGLYFNNEKTVIVTSQDVRDTDTVAYVHTTVVNGQYKAVIPVVAQNPGYVQIPAGVQVKIDNQIAQCIGAQIYSPITGGGDVQTNAQMFARCKAKCAATTGTSRAIQTRLQDAPYNVLSSTSIGTTQTGCLRSRDNNTLIPLYASVQTFVKTQNQPSIIQLQAHFNSDSQGKLTYTFISQQYPQIAGALSVISVTCPGSTQTAQIYNVQYGSSDDAVSADTARLSRYQDIKISNITKPSGWSTSSKITVAFMVMPSILDIDNYINDVDSGFIGQDITIKSAIPVALKIQCGVAVNQSISDDDILQMKQQISKIINQTPVGCLLLNMDDVASQFSQQFPQASLKLPYTIQASMLTTNGGYYTFNTVSGIVDLSYRHTKYMWQPKGYFMYTTPSDIQLTVL